MTSKMLKRKIKEIYTEVNQVYLFLKEPLLEIKLGVSCQLKLVTRTLYDALHNDFLSENHEKPQIAS